MLDLSHCKMRETETAVYFWGGPLSQWFPARFKQRLAGDGPLFPWNCAEQYMMAAKADLFGDRTAFDAICRSMNPAKQKRLGRAVRGFDQATWERAIPDILVRGNLGKFHANTPIANYLISTGGKRLAEGSPSDRIYGVGLRYDDPRIENEANWRGRNLLGYALEKVRNRIVMARNPRLDKSCAHEERTAS